MTIYSAIALSLVVLDDILLALFILYRNRKK